MAAFGPEHARAHLRERLGIAPGPAEPLSGGLLNHVFRVQRADGGSLIVKHAPPYVASRPELRLDPGRADFEARALAWVSRRPDQRIRVPALLDVHGHTLVMEDLGPCEDLGALLRRGKGLELLDTLGSWIGGLHADTAAPRAQNLAVQQTRLAVQYQAVGALLEQVGAPDAAVGGARALALGERLLEPGSHFVMGDLWPASVLVDPSGQPWVIDWELSTWGHPAQDLGHLAAHLWLLSESGAAPRGLAHRFLSAALADQEVPDAAVQDLLTHAACEVLVRTVGAFAGTGGAAGFVGKRAHSVRAAVWAGRVLGGWTPPDWGLGGPPKDP